MCTWPPLEPLHEGDPNKYDGELKVLTKQLEVQGHSSTLTFRMCSSGRNASRDCARGAQKTEGAGGGWARGALKQVCYEFSTCWNSDRIWRS